VAGSTSFGLGRNEGLELPLWGPEQVLRLSFNVRTGASVEPVGWVS